MIQSPSNATYDAATGILNITSNSHNLATGDKIQLADNSLTFMFNGQQYYKPYLSKSKDPAAQGWQEVTRVDANNFTIDVGKSPIVNYQQEQGQLMILQLDFLRCSLVIIT